MRCFRRRVQNIVELAAFWKMEEKPMERQVSGGGIRREELIESIVNKLTDPANESGRTKNGEYGREIKTFSWIGVAKRVYQKFRIYFQQLSVLLLSTIVVVMACSLRGNV